MRRSRWIISALLVSAIGVSALGAAAETPAAPSPDGRMIGMYIHQHWPYKHPYAARTWTIDDWAGYVGALQKLGYNTIVIWPVLETMPEPLTPSDRESLEKIARVIDMIHGLNMRVYLGLCPNIVADSAAAGQASFQDRHFFHSEVRVNPADAPAMAMMMQRREALFRPLAKTDGVFIIDSDPGGYPGSTNAEFVNLLVEHRRMFDRLRPGIELVYWMWAGWPAYARYYSTAKFGWGKPEEFEEVLTLLKQAAPEPWGIAYGLEHAQRLGLASKVIGLQYGAIESEPSWPLTNFGGEKAYNGGKNLGPRGVIGNAQTHCVQLPNTFAFVRGAQGKAAPTEADYVAFADELIVGRGRQITDAWKALGSGKADEILAVIGGVDRLAGETLEPGSLAGLLFGDAKRFVVDLAAQLRYAAALATLDAAAGEGFDLAGPLENYLDAIEGWYGRHGYENYWGAPEGALRRMKSHAVDDVLDPTLSAATPFGKVKERFYRKETFTPDLIRAMHRALGLRRATTLPSR